VNFAAKVDYATGSAPSGVAVGDFNADGRPDLAVANFNSGTVSVLLGTGGGIFAPKTDYPVGTSPTAGPHAVAVADFNGDGRPDLAVLNYQSDDSVSVLLNNGNGTFAAKTDYPTGFNPYSLAVGDFNGDGRPDLVSANNSSLSNSVSVLRNNGNGTFAAKVDYPAGTSPYGVAVGDFNGDFRADLAVNNQTGVSVFLNNGTGTFLPKVDYVTNGNGFSVAVGNFNADGHPDLVVPNYSTGTVSVLLGSSSGTFAPKLDYAAGPAPYLPAVGDFDGNGQLDLAVSNYGHTTDGLSVLPGQGNGAFGAREAFGTGSGPSAVAAGDFNSDGRLDLAVTNSTVSGTVSVLLSAPTSDISPSTLVFAKQARATNSPSKAVTVINKGSANLVINGFVFSKENADDFLIGSDTCHGPVAPGASCTALVRFSPQGSGARTAILTITSNASNAADAKVELSGTGGSLPAGPRGPRGRPGRDARVRCTVRQRTVSCTVSRSGSARAASRVSWRLSRGHRTYAHGTGIVRRGHWALNLRAVRHLRRGRYRLTVAAPGSRHGSSRVIRIR
jgi:hypothetical protein